MNRTGDVVHRHRLIDELVRLCVVHRDRARIGELGEPRPILFQLSEVRFRRHRDREHLAPFFGLADPVHLHPRAGLLDHPHVLVDLVRVRQLAWRAGDVTEDGLGVGTVFDAGR